MTNDDQPLSGEIVPFGKYRDQPVDVVLMDHGYREWLIAQPWVEQRYPSFYAAVISNGSSLVTVNPGSLEEHGSPEHNEMQARFLEPDQCLSIVRNIMDQAKEQERAFNKLRHWADCTNTGCCNPAYPNTPCEIERIMPGVDDIKFEDHGWDLTFQYIPTAVWWECICTQVAPEVGTESFYNKSWDEQQASWKARDHVARFHRTQEFIAYDSVIFGVELKPDLGDNYPAVLRQVQRYVANDQRRIRYSYETVPSIHVVIARRAQFRGVSLTQVRNVFKRAKISLLLESELAGN